MWEKLWMSLMLETTYTMPVNLKHSSGSTKYLKYFKELNIYENHEFQRKKKKWNSYIQRSFINYCCIYKRDYFDDYSVWSDEIFIMKLFTLISNPHKQTQDTIFFFFSSYKHIICRIWRDEKKNRIFYLLASIFL